MRLMLCFAVSVLSACSNTSANETKTATIVPRRESIPAVSRNASVNQSMIRALVGKRTLDGSVIDMISMKSDCSSEFHNASNTIKIDWSKQPNAAAYIESGQDIMPLTGTDNKLHKLQLGSGHDAERLSASITFLTLDCTKK